MAMTVRVCNAISILPLSDLVAAAEAHGETVPINDHAQYAGPVRCELAVEHDMDGAHCVYVKEWDDGTGNLWWRWLPNGVGEFVSVPACEAVSDDDDPQACYLIENHPREHSWEIFNPLREEAARDPQSFLPEGLGRSPQNE
ncbi:MULTISPECIES: hypothetical protein [unclassified Streptomyces]|uniref:hypothetical protein n=1 Tax=unclassified Streptomyces TaxID=2593676 RepID=UPI000DDB06B0|nr:MULTISPECIES: hypothetical protein [unclassified Streptomyces]QZZ30995.1 hypothetical protein A7X85_36390 [Streptomyces sp. ST1015]